MLDATIGIGERRGYSDDATWKWHPILLELRPWIYPRSGGSRPDAPDLDASDDPEVLIVSLPKLHAWINRWTATNIIGVVVARSNSCHPAWRW